MLMDKIPHKYIHLLYELSKVFEGLKKAYIQNDLGAWATATLQLDDSWKFTIEYEYEDVYLGIDNVQRIAVWEYETFGFLPEDEEDKEAVLNYLKNKVKNQTYMAMEVWFFFSCE
ncbi:immunity protein YezG family protein [Bacillus sp. A31]|uniref:immunity protein YezG family protein n=1 Tax=Bacillus sp. A31 TaxID=3102787 RepID=UPI0039B61F87